MAFGTLFDGDMTGESGQDIHVYVDREGYSGTTYSLRLKSDQLIVGQNGGGLFPKRAALALPPPLLPRERQFKRQK